MAGSVFALILIAGCVKTVETKTAEPEIVAGASAAVTVPTLRKVLPKVVSESASIEGYVGSLDNFGQIQIKDGAEFEVFARGGDGSDKLQSSLIEFEGSSANSGKPQSQRTTDWQRFDQTFDN